MLTLHINIASISFSFNRWKIIIPLEGLLSVRSVCCVSGSVPLDPQLTQSLEEGTDFLQAFPESATFSSINTIANTLLSRIQDD